MGTYQRCKDELMRNEYFFPLLYEMLLNSVAPVKKLKHLFKHVNVVDLDR